MPIDTLDQGRARDSRRLRKTANVTGVAATGIVTFPGGFLDNLGPGDVLRFTAKTGGSGVALATNYYLIGKKWALGATTAQLSATLGGVPLALGTDLTATSTVETGQILSTDGILAGNLIPMGSPAGGADPE